MATAADVTAMNDKEAAVRAALEKAEDETSGFSWFRTAAQDAAVANIAAARTRYEQWADGQTESGWRYRAIQGLNPQGFPYADAVKFWLQIGNDLLSELGVHVQASQDGGALAVLENTVSQTAQDIANLPSGTLPKFWPEDWKEKVKKAAWIAGAVGAVALLGWVAVEVAPLVALFSKRKRKEA